MATTKPTRREVQTSVAIKLAGAAAGKGSAPGLAAAPAKAKPNKPAEPVYSQSQVDAITAALGGGKAGGNS